MKKCPKCAEEVQDEAKVCRYCAYKFAQWGDLFTPKLGCGTIAVLVIVMIFSASRMNNSSVPTPIAASSADYSTATVARCDELIAKGEKNGLIRKRPTTERIDVDELAWAALPADSKKGLLLALACSSFQRPLRGIEGVVAYGYRSGKRLAMATSVGVDLE